MREAGPETVLTVVAPVYNEAGGIEPFVNELQDCLQALSFPGTWEILLVDDGSTDGSDAELDALARRHPEQVSVLHLARNFGHPAAVTAGLDHARGDIVILLDSDFQDDPHAFGAFLEKWREGYDVVYAVRTHRQDSRIIRFFTWSFYRMIRALGQISLPLDAGNFALMDRRVVRSIRALPERNRYMPGLRTWVGFKQTGVPVPRRARRDKRSRVGVRGLWTLAMNATFSFSYVPIFVFRVIGVCTLAFSMLLTAYALVQRLITGEAVATSTAFMATTAFFGGINLLGISMIGEYVARIYDEVKQRPLYVVDRIAGSVETQADIPKL